MYHLVNALQHLHSKGICHRDLSAGNVLIHKMRSNAVFVVSLFKLFQFRVLLIILLICIPSYCD